MLVHHRPRQVPAQHLAAVAHGQGQGGALGGGHAAQQGGHGEGGDLAFAEAVVDDAADQPLEILSREFQAIALLADNLLGKPHGRTP